MKSTHVKGHTHNIDSYFILFGLGINGMCFQLKNNIFCTYIPKRNVIVIVL